MTSWYTRRVDFAREGIKTSFKRRKQRIVLQFHQKIQKLRLLNTVRYDHGTRHDDSVRYKESETKDLHGV